MSRLLHRLGRSTAAHPWRTIFAWLLVAVGVYALAGSIGGTPQDNWDIPNARAQVGIDQLREHTPGAGNASARVVVHTRDGSPVDAAVTAPLTQRLEQMPHVGLGLRPATQRRPRHRAAHRGVRRPGDRPRPATRTSPRSNKAVDPTRDAGIQVELGGDLPDTAAAPMRGTGELIGIVAALLILVLAFGSVVSAGLPIAVALIGLGRRLGGHHPARRDHGRQHDGPDGGHDGRPRSRHRLRPAAGHPVRGVPPVRATTRSRPPAARSPRPDARWSSPRRPCWSRCWACKLAGLPTYDAVRLRHRDRRRRRRLGGADPGARPVRPGRTPAAAAQGTQGTRPQTGQPADGALGHPRGPASAGLGPDGRDRDAARWRLPPCRMRTWPQDSSAQPSDLTTRKAYDLVADEFGPGANGPIMFVQPRASATPESPRWPRRSRSRDDIATVSPVGRIRRRRAADLRGRADVRPDRRAHARPGRRPARRGAAGRRDHRHHSAVRRHRRHARGRGSGSWSGSWSRSPCCCSAWCSARSWSRSRRRVMNLLSIGAAYGVLTAGLPVGLGRQPARPRPLDAGVELDADPDVRGAVRPVDGLRGVPALPDPRGLAGHRRRPRQRRTRTVGDRPGHHRRRRDHGRRLPRLRQRGRRRGQAARRRHGRRDPARRDRWSGWSSCPPR